MSPEPGYVSIAGVKIPKLATWAGVTALVAGVVSVTSIGMKLDQRLSNIENGMGDRWTRTDMIYWVERLKDRTDGKFNVPNVQEHYRGDK